MALLKAVMGFVVLCLIVFGGWFVYENFLAGEIQDFWISNYNADIEASLANVSGDVEQFYTNMRFNHNRLSYYINPECSNEKKSRMIEAFDIIESSIDNLISFYSISESRADILIGCSADSYEKEENIFVAGEGGPTKIINSSIPVITKGKVLLYNESRSICDEPLLEIHELFHVFGYNHIGDKDDIMYPYLDCDQEINPDLIAHMKQLYSIAPFAELYFDVGEMVAYKERYAGKWYLNFNVSIDNNGIINAEESVLKVYAQDNLIESVELDDIDFGGGERFYVKNLVLKPQSATSIKFDISTTTKESNIQNNILELKI